jgi:RecG-like helicase
MDDNVLLNIALSVAVVGIISLLILSYYDKIPEKNFNEITSDNIDSQTTVKGIVQQIYMHNNSMSIKLKQECLMDIFLFEKNQSLSVGDNLTVEGTVQEYNGRMSILADKITRNR